MSITSNSITASILGAGDSTVLTISEYDEAICGELEITAKMADESELDSFLDFTEL